MNVTAATALAASIVLLAATLPTSSPNPARNARALPNSLWLPGIASVAKARDMGPDQVPLNALACYPVALIHTGNGSDPIASPSKSPGCAEGHYVVGTRIFLTAYPAPGATVRSWFGTDNDNSHFTTNFATWAGQSFIRVHYMGGAPCLPLILRSVGDGFTPTASVSSYTCPAGYYVAGEPLEVRARPYYGAYFSYWQGTGALGSGEGLVDPYSSVTMYYMPAVTATVVAYFNGATNCRALTLSHSGSGSDPVPNVSSTLCPAGHYAPGESLMVTASPGPGASVAYWTGTRLDATTSLNNQVSMPGADHTVMVHYTGGTCYPLMLTHTGNGGDPAAFPPSSSHCPAGHFASSEPISLTASPEAGHHVESWSGTDMDDSNSTTNRLSMPMAAAEVTAHYAPDPPCYPLTLAHTGSGSDPTAVPNHSAYCPAGQYAAGTAIHLRAAPGAGYHVGSWLGTSNDASSSADNGMAMPSAAATVTVNYVANPPCYGLHLSHTGAGGNPAAVPAWSDTCPIGQYVEGEAIGLTAYPATGYHVAAWSGTDNDASDALTNTLVMPAGDVAVTVSYTTCYQLALAHTGSGSNPSAFPISSTHCAAGQYVAGELITVTAAPATNYYVAAWSGTDNDASTALINTLVMPAGYRTVSAQYRITCHQLSLNRNQSFWGSYPTATPTRSIGCLAGNFVPGEGITLTAAPAAGYHVASWSGTDNDASDAPTNTLSMPAGNAAVTVNYAEDCRALSLTHTGNGDDPAASPASSDGCSTGRYHANELINLTAAPAVGYRVLSWSDLSTSAVSRSMRMPSRDYTVTVNYAPQCYYLGRNYTGYGGYPAASPAQSQGCSGGYYVYGQPITLTATPAAGYRVASWSGTDNDASDGLTNTLSMPAGAHAIRVTYTRIMPICYTLVLSHTGGGSNPSASPGRSIDCSPDQYVSGEAIRLRAAPAEGCRVASWSGTDDDGSTSVTNTVTMPTSSLTVLAHYDVDQTSRYSVYVVIVLR
jgi:hypothetical protein